MQQYELINYDRVLRFTGERIAHATSRRNISAERDQLRWTDVDIYRTKGNQYVLHKVGKSRVYHGGPNMCSGSGGRTTTSRVIFGQWEPDKVLDLAPCPVCKPPILEDMDKVNVERDRGVTFTSATGRGVVESAYSQDEDDVTYLTKVSERALRAASEVDDEIREAFLIETIA